MANKNLPRECPLPQTDPIPSLEEDKEQEDNEVDEDGKQIPWPHAPSVAGSYLPAPTVEEAALALVDLKLFLCPPRDSGAGYKDPNLDLLLRSRLERLQMFLWNYTDPKHKGHGWMAASLETAHAFEKGPWLAGRLQEWARAYISDRESLPMNIYGAWNSSVLEDKDFAQELHLHLQGIGKYVHAMDIVDYVAKPEVAAWLKLTKPIHLATAQHWMKKMGYRWTKTPTGQFVDGHKRDDVVAYRQTVFLPILAELLSQTRVYDDGIENRIPHLSGRCMVIWNHDESTYYANDCRKI